MHDDSMKLMRMFKEKYLKGMEGSTVLDIGARMVDSGSQQTYREILEPDFKYTGMDVEAGTNVDIVGFDNLKGMVFDIVVSGQTMEHVNRPWEWLKSLVPLYSKYICIIAPWKFGEHRYPIDTYRYLPDGMRDLFNYAEIKVVDIVKGRVDTMGIGEKCNGGMRKMQRFDIINHLIKLHNYKTYLEIGVRRKKNFKRVKAKVKHGVDPEWDCTFKMTSDKFFSKNHNMYDIIFIDGLHEHNQVLRDVQNSLQFLNKNGTIIMHDCNPKRFKHQIDEYPGKGVWNGTVWKAFVKLRMSRDDLYMYVVDSDFGIGIIQRGEQELLKIREEDVNYSFFRKNKKKMLNIISVEKFKERNV